MAMAGNNSKMEIITQATTSTEGQKGSANITGITELHLEGISKTDFDMVKEFGCHPTDSATKETTRTIRNPGRVAFIGQMETHTKETISTT